MTSTLLVTLLNVSLFGCNVNLHPCSCKFDNSTNVPTTEIGCEKTSSYSEIYDKLNGRFGQINGKIVLEIKNSNLEDLPFRSFKELNISIERLLLNHDRLTYLNETTFEGLDNLKYFSLADNYFDQVPEHIWRHLPNLGTLDLGRLGLTTLTEANFRNLPKLTTLTISGNHVSRMDSNTIPPSITTLYMNRNMISSLNGTLNNLSQLQWLVMSANNLTDIEDELPTNPSKLKMIHASANRLSRLPKSLRHASDIETLFLDNNEIVSLDGHIAPLRKLSRLQLSNNKINILRKNEFAETEALHSILLSNNDIKSLNNSLVKLKNLRNLNLTHNEIEEFGFHEITGLKEMTILDLSFNRISTLMGPTSNVLEWEVYIHELYLQHNKIEVLNGSLSGLNKLRVLNLSHNKIKKLLPDDLIGLDHLVALDVSYNFLTSLEETSKTFLPRLQELKAIHNYLTVLDKDFHGLPVLCKADFESNQIVALGRELVSKTRCMYTDSSKGTFDTLTIVLQGNPILCDAALPEISAVMEINHTRIEGVSQCQSEPIKPITSKPNAYLGYYEPSTTTSKPKPVIPLAPLFPTPEVQQVAPQSIESIPDILVLPPEPNADEETLSNQPSLIAHEMVNSQTHIKQDMEDILYDANQMVAANDSSKLSKLESEIEQLKSKVDMLVTQLESDGRENKKN